ncbi:MAG: hypothetical protein ABSG62_10120 [Terracidiphilus sp.]|jgi:hypothetical protein
MKFPRSLFSVAIAAAFSASLFAQQAPSGYHSVACIKVKPEKAAEFRKWYAEDVRKVQQSRADSGAIAVWYLLRSVIPAGTSAECDYLSISIYPGAPPKPLELHELGAVLKKAGLNTSAQEYVDRRNSLTELVSNNLFQNRISVGGAKKGDYFMVNYMKVVNMGDWIAYEKKVWQPLAESLVQAGVTSGWSVNVQVLPRGSDLPFDAVTVDVYPSWDAVFAAEAHLGEHFKKAHPDMEVGTTMEQFEKLRTILSTSLFTVQDMVTPAK